MVGRWLLSFWDLFSGAQLFRFREGIHHHQPFQAVGLGAPSWDLEASTGRSAAHGYPAPLAKLVSPKRHLKLINSQPQPPPTTPTLPSTKNNKEKNNKDNLPTNKPTLYANIPKKKKTTASPAVFPSSLFGIELLPGAAYLWGGWSWLIGGTQDRKFTILLLMAEIRLTSWGW